MANTPVISVGAPDELGLRKVIIDGKSAGRVWSPRELQRLLIRAGVAFGHDIQWIGGDSTVWPDRPWPRRIIGTVMAVGLLMTACVLAKIGIADTLDALTYGGRIAGFTFLVLALIEVIAALATLDYWRKRQMKYSGVIVLFGALISLGISSVLLIVEISGHVYNLYLPLWVTLTLWSSWALWILVRSRAWEGIRNPGRIAIGALIPALLAATNLTYSQFYVPYVTSPLVQSGAEFRTPSLDKEKKTMYLPVHLYAKNSGQVPVYILGSIFWIKGLLPKGNSKYNQIDSREFVIPPGRALNPGEELAQDAVIEIHNPGTANYEAVSAQTELYVIRKDRMTMSANYERSKAKVKDLKASGHDFPKGPPGAEFRYQSVISNSNELLNVTRGRQCVSLWWARNTDGSTYIHVDVTPPGEKRTSLNLGNVYANKATINRYGLARVRGSMAQAPFVELQEKAQNNR
ncbi:hypothetical protein OG429_29725 [Streptomyces sp. NBC_00190]|uniref:hypothetical protein n=1 Tax=unclassified Streptomyces TaxID=2593676 RepID=UPI002E2CBF88|nr:hypothetical protein [Streptomyces sp. NBC_00190]WSZ43099.1 hypothetical protein OG239_32360 [Streptomyces sp. NBC_00868]